MIEAREHPMNNSTPNCTQEKYGVELVAIRAIAFFVRHKEMISNYAVIGIKFFRVMNPKKRQRLTEFLVSQTMSMLRCQNH